MAGSRRDGDEMGLVRKGVGGGLCKKKKVKRLKNISSKKPPRFGGGNRAAYLEC